MKAKYKSVVFIGVVIFFFMGVISSHAEELSVQSKISEVTVYPGAAHVTRSANMNLKKGEHSIKFENIIPQIDENSLTVAGEGRASVKIFGAYMKREHLKQPTDERVKEIKDKIEKIEDTIATKNNDIKVLEQEREFLNSIKLFSGNQIPKDLVTNMPGIEQLNSVLTFLSENLKKNEGQKEDARLNIRELQKEKQRLERELSELRNTGNKMQRSIVVDIACVNEGNFDLKISYLVGGANWMPLYDARASYEKGEVELTAYGVIDQRTGEDWEDVKLTLSTAKPTLGGRMPYVSSWVLRGYQPRASKRKMFKGGIRMASDSIGDQYQAFDKEEALSANTLAEKEYSQVSSSGISVTYGITRPVTIKSDGSDNKFPITSQMLKTDYEFSTFPKTKEFSYLGSRVTNSKDLQLLAGQVNLFLEEDFIGKSSIDNIGPGEDFDLFLGVDESVKVERKRISKKIDDILIAGIPSPNKKTIIKNRLTVENYKQKKIKVKLFEAMPVSENERIKVKILDISQKPGKKDWKDRKGIWLWDLKLDPKEKIEIFYTFIIEHPKKMSLEGF